MTEIGLSRLYEQAAAVNRLRSSGRGTGSFADLGRFKRKEQKGVGMDTSCFTQRLIALHAVAPKKMNNPTRQSVGSQPAMKLKRAG